MDAVNHGTVGQAVISLIHQFSISPQQIIATVSGIPPFF